MKKVHQVLFAALLAIPLLAPCAALAQTQTGIQSANNVFQSSGFNGSNYATINGSCSSAASSCTITGGAVLGSGSGVAILNYGGGSAQEAVCFTGVTPTSITFGSFGPQNAVGPFTCTPNGRGIWGSSATTFSTGKTILLVTSFLSIISTSAPVYWTGQDGIVVFGSAVVPNNSQLQGVNFNTSVLSSQGYYLGASTSTSQIKAADNGLGVYSSSGNLFHEADSDGITGNLNGTLAMVSTTATLAPATGVVVITGTPSTQPWLTMTVPTGVCTETGLSCAVTVINTTSGSITTGSGTSAGNFAAAYTLAKNAAMQCTAYGSTELWYCR